MGADNVCLSAQMESILVHQTSDLFPYRKKFQVGNVSLRLFLWISYFLIIWTEESSWAVLQDANFAGSSKGDLSLFDCSHHTERQKSTSLIIWQSEGDESWKQALSWDNSQKCHHLSATRTLLSSDNRLAHDSLS